MGFAIDNLKQFIVVVLFIWSFTTVIPFINLGANNLIAFFMLYAIVVMIRRLDITFERYRSTFIGFMLIPYGIAIMSIIILDLLAKQITIAAEYSCYFMRGNYRPVSMMVSVGLFMWGSSWKLQDNKWKNYLAEATFGVYLFHMYPPVMRFLFEKVFSLQYIVDKPYALLYLIAVTIIIFMSGVLVESVRKILFYIATILISKIIPNDNFRA